MEGRSNCNFLKPCFAYLVNGSLQTVVLCYVKTVSLWSDLYFIGSDFLVDPKQIRMARSSLIRSDPIQSKLNTVKSNPVWFELFKSSLNPIRTRSDRIRFGFGSDLRTSSLDEDTFLQAGLVSPWALIRPLTNTGRSLFVAAASFFCCTEFQQKVFNSLIIRSCSKSS